MPSGEDDGNTMQEVMLIGDEEDVISFEEVQKAVDHMKNNKSPGCDGLPADLQKRR